MKVEVYGERNSPSDEHLIIHEVMCTVGQSVKKDEILLVVEGSKALFDILSPVSGILTELKVSTGDVVPVGSILGMIECGKFLSSNNQDGAQIAVDD